MLWKTLEYCYLIYICKTLEYCYLVCKTLEYCYLIHDTFVTWSMVHLLCRYYNLIAGTFILEILLPNFGHICSVNNTYHKISDIRPTKSQNSNVSHLWLQLSLRNILKPSVKVENEDVVGAAPKGGAPTTSEWSTTTKVRLILVTWR